MALTSTVERWLRLGLLVVPLFAMLSAIEVGCVGGGDPLATESYGPGTGNGYGYGTYGYTRARSWEEPAAE